MSNANRPKIIRGFKRAKIERRDPQKESVYRGLASILTENGYIVRREELRRGIGFSVSSGNCRLATDNLVFVDRRLSQDEQIAFLTDRIIGLGVKPSVASVAGLPENLAKRLVL